MQKRRLEMMPEVLPAPTVTPPLAPRGNVRARTMQHMQRMVATAGALGAVTGCTKSDTTTTQTVTVPSATSTTTATTTATSPLASASATATSTATSVPTGPPDHGYAVVDPMPMPSRCASAAQASKATATYVQQGKDLVLKITLKMGGGASWTGGPVSPYSGVAVKSVTSNAAKDSVDVFLPVASSGFSIPVTCSAGTASMGVSVTTPSKPAKAGDTAPANVYDQPY